MQEYLPTLYVLGCTLCRCICQFNEMIQVTLAACIDVYYDYEQTVFAQTPSVLDGAGKME
jgi:hypothetical protein